MKNDFLKIIRQDFYVKYSFILFLSLLYALIIIFYPIYALIILIVSILIFLIFYNIKVFLFILLVLKPLIDLTWNGPTVNIFNVNLNIQSFVAIFTLILFSLYIFLFENPKITIPTIFLLVFFLINCIGFSIADKNFFAVRDFVRVSSSIPLIFLGWHVFSDREKVLKFGQIYLLILYIPMGIAIMQKLGIIEWGYHTYIGGERFFRSTGGYMHPFGLFRDSYLAVPFIFLLWEENISIRKKLFLMVSLIIICFGITLTLLRMAIIAVLFQLILSSWLNRKKIFTLMIILTCFFLILLFQSVNLLFKNPMYIERYEVFNQRGAVWIGYFELFKSGSYYQKLIGFGPFSDASMYANKYLNDDLIPNDPHNDFIRILVENGILGLTSYFLFLLTLYLSIKKFRKTDNKFLSRYANFALIIFITFLLMSVTGEPTEKVTSFWFLLVVFSPIVMNVNIKK